MNMYNMKLEQFQVNTKFLNTLPSEWSTFVTDVKLVRDLHTTNVDQLHAYLGPSLLMHSISHPQTDTSSLVNHNVYLASSSAPQEESLHTYYLIFTQLINNMNIYKMKMEQFQVNTKFLNSLPSEWSMFETDVKLVKYLHTSNFDQLHAYLEQLKLHANEVCLLRKCNQDPLAFVSNQQMTPPQFNTYQSFYNNPQLQQQFSPLQHGSIEPNQHYSSHFPSQTHFNHSSIPP
nr:hypothetical protein [Tanacetum cinerariifolium]